MLRYWHWNRLVDWHNVRFRYLHMYWYVVRLGHWIVFWNMNNVRLRYFHHFWYGVRLWHRYWLVDVDHFRNMNNLEEKKIRPILRFCILNFSQKRKLLCFCLHCLMSVPFLFIKAWNFQANAMKLSSVFRFPVKEMNLSETYVKLYVLNRTTVYGNDGRVTIKEQSVITPDWEDWKKI